MKKTFFILCLTTSLFAYQKTESKTSPKPLPITMQYRLINEEFDLIDCDIKTNNRPDGNVIKYFNPKPVIQNEKYDIALSLYYNETTSTYFISTSVLFKRMEIKDLTGDLLIQTDSNNGIQLTQVLSNKVTMNGEVLSVGMYELTKRDIEILKKANIKSVFIYLDGNQYGNTLNINRNLLVQQFKCFFNQ